MLGLDDKFLCNEGSIPINTLCFMHSAIIQLQLQPLMMEICSEKCIVGDFIESTS